MDRTAVAAAVKSKAKAVGLRGEAEWDGTRATVASQASARLAAMGAAGRAEAKAAYELVKSRGVEKVDRETFKLAMSFAPTLVTIMAMGEVKSETTPALVEAVCTSFPSDEKSFDAELSRIEKLPEAEATARNVAFKLFEGAKPPGASDYRRLQTAGLTRLAHARALENGSKDQDPAWLDNYLEQRAISNAVTTVQEEADLIMTIWASAGVLPADRRAEYLEVVIANASRAEFDHRFAITLAVRQTGGSR